MRAVVTRVSSASVTIDGTVSGQIGTGYLVLLGIGPEDTSAQVTRLADKICHLRVFSDENGKMNLDLETVGGALLVISQFTLYAEFLDACRSRGFQVEHGQFGADMQVASVNDGPVTLLFDTDTL